MDLLTVQGTLKSLLQHHSSKASILQHSAFFIVQISHPYMTTGKATGLTRWTFVSKVMSLLFNMLPRFVIAFLPRSKCLLISWLQSPSAELYAACQAPLSKGFSRQDTGVDCHSLLQGIFPKPRFPELQVGSLPSEPPGKPGVIVL